MNVAREGQGVTMLRKLGGHPPPPRACLNCVLAVLLLLLLSSFHFAAAAAVVVVVVLQCHHACLSHRGWCYHAKCPMCQQRADSRLGNQTTEQASGALMCFTPIHTEFALRTAPSRGIAGDSVEKSMWAHHFFTLLHPEMPTDVVGIGLIAHPHSVAWVTGERLLSSWATF